MRNPIVPRRSIDLAHLLQSAPHEALCAACLAFAVRISLDEARAAVRALLQASRSCRQELAQCSGCLRTVLVTRWTPSALA